MNLYFFTIKWKTIIFAAAALLIGYYPRRTTDTYYTPFEDVSFVAPPHVLSYGSSTDSNLDALIASNASASIISDLHKKPSRFRVVIPESRSQLVMESDPGNATSPLRFTIRTGLSEDEFGPGLVQQNSAAEASGREREWKESTTALYMTHWLCADDGRLALPMVRQESLLTAGTNRAGLFAVMMGLQNTAGSGTLAEDSARAIMYFYSLARNLAIRDLEVHLAEKWCQGFDSMTEQPSVFLLALQILNETGDLRLDPLTPIILEQLAYATLWSLDVREFAGDARATSTDILQRISGFSDRFFDGGYMSDLSFMGPSIDAALAEMVERVCTDIQNDGVVVCDFVGAKHEIIYTRRLAVTN